MNIQDVHKHGDHLAHCKIMVIIDVKNRNINPPQLESSILQLLFPIGYFD